MLEKNNKGLSLELMGNKLIIEDEAKIRLTKASLFIMLVLYVMLLIRSSLRECIRNIFLEALAGLRQFVLFQKPECS